MTELERVRAEADHIRRLTTALVQAESTAQITNLIVGECKTALAADAMCLHLLAEDGTFEMVAESGCTPQFKTQWQRVTRDMLPLLNLENPHESLFFDSADAFKTESPGASELVDRSGRKAVAYAPLVVKRSVIGFLGFSYNSSERPVVENRYVLTLVNLFAQALERVRSFEREHAARLEAESANQAKSEFLANISHELRTPIGVVQGFADLLSGTEGLNESQRHWASLICRNARQLADLIGDVLDISRIEAAKLDLNLEWFSLSELIDDIQASAKYRVGAKNLKFEMVADGLPSRIWSDRVRLRQIVLNLIDNAIKFTEEGFVRVTMQLTPNSNLETVVEDTGIGVDLTQQTKIFEPFAQGETSISRRFGGTGLGLTIAGRLARALGGDLSLVSSVPGEGSIFKFEIPFVQPELEKESEAECNNDVSQQASLHGVKVLLVDDCLDNQELVASILESEGVCVDVASSGLEGVRLALRGSHDVVLMDIQMPNLDGFAAVSLLRAQGYATPIAALTAFAIKNEKEKAMDRGFDDYLTKPIDLAVFLETVRRLGSARAGSKRIRKTTGR